MRGNTMRRMSIIICVALAFFGTSATTAADTSAPVDQESSPLLQESGKSQCTFPAKNGEWFDDAASFPNPMQEGTTTTTTTTTTGCCNSSFDRICNPDSILNEESIGRIAPLIEEYENKLKVNCEGEFEQVEIAIVVVQKMDLSPFQDSEDMAGNAAEALATSLHNKWGVGKPTSCGGTGIILFLSIDDRTIFFSMGDTIKPILTHSRIQRIIGHMKRSLQEERHGEAIVLAMQLMENFILQGKLTWLQYFVENFLETLIFSLTLGYILLFRGWWQRRQARIYARVHSELTELEQSHALALQGKYQCKSCPICFEDFVRPSVSSFLSPDENNSAQEESNNNNESRAQDSETSSNRSSSSSGSSSPLGSDGLPLKLLRCGHAFDETCFAQWVSSGSGNVRKCPICNQDMGESTTTEPLSTNAVTAVNGNDDGAFRQRRVAAPAEVVEEEEQQQQQMIEPIQRRDADDRNDRMQAFQREREFRMMRLRQRFPPYIIANQQILRRWSQEGFFDGSMAKHRAPTRRSSDHYSDRGIDPSARSFGGGQSGGGFGGKW